MISPYDLPFTTQLYEYNRISAPSDDIFFRIAISHARLVGSFLLIDSKKIMPQPGGREILSAKHNQNNRLGPDRRPTGRGERSIFRIDFPAKPRFTMPESSKNL